MAGEGGEIRETGGSGGGGGVVCEGLRGAGRGRQRGGGTADRSERPPDRPLVQLRDREPAGDTTRGVHSPATPPTPLPPCVFIFSFLCL